MVPPGLRKASYDTLAADGIAALDPTRLALFSTAQHAEPGFPFVPFTRALEVEWTEGRDLHTGQRIAVPAPLVWPSYITAMADHHAPPTNPILQAGLAAGTTTANACWSALREVVERDTMTMSWAGRGGLRPLDPPPWLARLAQGPRSALSVRFFGFGNAYRLAVVGAVVIDATTGYVTLGMGALPNSTSSMIKALGESPQLQLLMAEYDNPTGPFARAAHHPGSPLKAWRAERDYSRAYRADLRDVVDYGCHLQMFLDPVYRAAFEAELADAVHEWKTADRRSTTEANSDPAPASPPAEETPEAASCVRAMVQRFADAGEQVIAVEVTTPDVQAAGLHVVRVLVTGTYSNSPAGLPFLGGARFSEQLATLGVQRRKLPLPH
ncbi:MAG: YcaO-like family protein [Pseudonocardiales bacterium]|nr:YcaO-like family protein [Pseudonocardiales bacterium]MBV9028853.1 YcaO-like family protein [Pseudonocardiales bacterium]